MQRIITVVIVLAAVGIVSAFERDHLISSGEAADCAAANLVVTVTTLGSGQKPGLNEAVSHRITGNIVGGADAYGPRANHFRICSGTSVRIQLVGAFVPGDVEFLRGPLNCIDFPAEGAGCGVDSLTEIVIYRTTSPDGTDIDRITLVPVD